jgi:phosphohistidine phosphatase
MELYFFRHGIAVDREDPSVDDDRERPLTRDGIRKTYSACEGLARMELKFDQILTSPWLRAVQTARILAEVLEMSDHIEEMAELAGDRSVNDLVAGLARYKTLERVVLVGHQPLLGAGISYLLTGKTTMEVDLKKSGVCAIELNRIPPTSGGTLRWMLTPRQLRMMR